MSAFGSVPNLLTARSLIAESWIFDASAKTLSVPGTGNARVVFVVNVEKGVVIFNPANPATTGDTKINRYLEFDFNTADMSDSDELLIFCEVPEKLNEEIIYLKDIYEELRVQTRLLANAFSTDRQFFEEK